MKTEEKELGQAKLQSTSQKHHGHAIKRLRRDKGMSQRELASLIGMSRQVLSYYETEDVVDDDVLQQIAKGLNVSVDLIKELEDDKSFAYYIENNRFTSPSNFGGTGNTTIGSIEVPKENTLLKMSIEKLENAYEDNRKQFESIIGTYKEMVEILKQEIQELKEKISSGKN